MTRSTAVYCSALVLIFPAFGTRHTFYADRAAAFFFSNIYDFLGKLIGIIFHTLILLLLPSNVPSRSRKTVVICLLLVPCFPFSVRLVGLSKIYGCVAGCLG